MGEKINRPQHGRRGRRLAQGAKEIYPMITQQLRGKKRNPEREMLKKEKKTKKIKNCYRKGWGCVQK